VQISRLYRPLDTDPLSDDEEEIDDDIHLVGLPRYTPSSSTAPRNINNSPAKPKPKGSARLTDVWDEREELFGVGDDSGDDEDVPQRSHSGVPKITVTGS